MTTRARAIFFATPALALALGAFLLLRSPTESQDLWANGRLACESFNLHNAGFWYEKLDFAHQVAIQGAESFSSTISSSWGKDTTQGLDFLKNQAGSLTDRFKTLTLSIIHQTCSASKVIESYVLLPRRASLFLSLSVGTPWLFHLANVLPGLAGIYALWSFAIGGLGIPALLILPIYAYHLHSQTGYRVAPIPLSTISTILPLVLVLSLPLFIALIAYGTLTWHYLAFWALMYDLGLRIINWLPQPSLPVGREAQEEAAEKVAVSYEYRWMAYRRLSLIATGFWIYGVSRLLRNPGYLVLSIQVVSAMFLPKILRDYLGFVYWSFIAQLASGKCGSLIQNLWIEYGAPIVDWTADDFVLAESVWTQQDTTLALNTFAILVLPLFVFALEHYSIRAVPLAGQRPFKPNRTISKEDKHPLTGRPFTTMEQRASVALAVAPAGTPVLEAGLYTPFVTLFMSTLAGPGFPLTLWWSAGEEKNGWLARSAARSVVAPTEQTESKPLVQA